MIVRLLWLANDRVLFALLDPCIPANATAIAELRTVVTADHATVEKEQDAQN